MNKKHHVYGGMLILALIHIIISIFHLHDSFPNPTFALAVGYFGINFPDEDMIDGSLRFHRSAITHSCIIPLLITISYLFSGFFAVIYFVMYFPLGVSTHLFLDIITNSIPSEYSSTLTSRWKYRIKKLSRGEVSGKFKGPLAAIANKNKLAWLLINGLICIVLAGVLYCRILYQMGTI